MEILYVSSVPSNQEFYRMKEQLKDPSNIVSYGMNESGFKFHSLVQKGLVANGITLTSLVGRSINHHTYKGLFWKGRKEVNQHITYHHLPCVNLPVIKQFFFGWSFLIHTLTWLMKNRKKETAIVMDAAYVSVIPFVFFAALFYRVKKIAIFCDIYTYMGAVDDARDATEKRSIHRLIRSVIQGFYGKLDGFIVLTEAMNAVINKNHKPYMVMEGLVDVTMKGEKRQGTISEDKTIILYAGALREKYGLKNLINGFLQYENDRAELWIYGAGDYAATIQNASQKDARIRLFGVVANEEVVRAEMAATLLVNPRPVHQEFTKYSFPSKNMEYMVSGTPVLTTRLPGMPQDYYPHIYTIDGDGEQDMLHALEQTLALPREELVAKGERAKVFVLQNKNNIIQAGRILSLLSEHIGFS